MTTRRGIFAVVIDKKNNLLVLHRVHNWTGWEVAKGGIDGKYSEKKCLKNELWEELNLEKKDYTIIGKSNCFLTYNYPLSYQRKWNVKSAKFRGWLVLAKKRKISFKNNSVKEHNDYKWMPLKKALKKLTFANQRKAVKSVAKQFGL